MTYTQTCRAQVSSNSCPEATLDCQLASLRKARREVYQQLKNKIDVRTEVDAQVVSWSLEVAAVQSVIKEVAENIIRSLVSTSHPDYIFALTRNNRPG